MKVVLIAAMNQDRVIGKDGGLPWHLPDDLKFFKRTTSGHAVIMGRKTFDSIGRPLPKRRNIVITRNPDRIAGTAATAANAHSAAAPTAGDGARAARERTSLDVVDSLDAALELCRRRDEATAFVIGGAQIYALALPHADEMLITHVDQPGIEGDTHFPEWERSKWRDAGPADPAYPSARRYTRR